MIFKFLSSISHPNVCLDIVSNKQSSLRCVETNILRKLNYKRLLHLMAIFRSVSDLTRVLALC